MNESDWADSLWIIDHIESIVLVDIVLKQYYTIIQTFRYLWGFKICEDKDTLWCNFVL